MLEIFILVMLMQKQGSAKQGSAERSHTCKAQAPSSVHAFTSAPFLIRTRAASKCTNSHAFSNGVESRGFFGGLGGAGGATL